MAGDAELRTQILDPARQGAGSMTTAGRRPASRRWRFARLVEKFAKPTSPLAGAYQQATDLYLPRSMARIGNVAVVRASSLGLGEMGL